jgi:CheY-like chemotaxis protein
LGETSTYKGFGLFNIRERIEAMGGRLSLQSAPGAGTMARFELPLTVASNATPEVARPERTSPPIVKDDSTALRVLLVDDHVMVRQGLRSILDNYIDVVVVGEACDGEEAVNSVEALLPDIVIMYINMPKMDGITATRLIKSRHATVSVVGISVNADVAHEAAIMDAGAAILLTKEAAVEQLYDTIKQFAKKRYSV